MGDFMSSELYLWKKGNTWARVEPDGNVRVGVIPDVIRKYPKVAVVRFVVSEGASVKQGDKIASIGVGKTTITVEAPISGTIININAKAKTTPAIIKKDPTGEGWLIVIKPSKLEEDLKNLVKG